MRVSVINERWKSVSNYLERIVIMIDASNSNILVNHMMAILFVLLFYYFKIIRVIA